MDSAALCVCGHSEEDHVDILGCAANCATREGGGVDFSCSCEKFEPGPNENEEQESYPLSLGD